MPSALPEPGQIVIVRRRPFVVNDIQASTLPLPANVQDQSSRQHLLRLSSIEDEGLGEELSVIWELEPGVTSLDRAQLPALKGFDSPRIFDAFLDAVTPRPRSRPQSHVALLQPEPDRQAASPYRRAAPVEAAALLHLRNAPAAP
jgi:hypothetical protein